MSYRGSDNGAEKARPRKVYTAPLSLQAQKPKAFREWLDASNAWSAYRQAIKANGYSSTARRELEVLERRLNAAAEALEQSPQRLSDPPPCAATAGGGPVHSE